MRTTIRILIRFILIWLFLALTVFCTVTFLRLLLLYGIRLPISSERLVICVRFFALPIGTIAGLFIADKFLFRTKNSIFFRLFVAFILSVIGVGSGALFASKVGGILVKPFLFATPVLSLIGYLLVPMSSTKKEEE